MSLSLPARRYFARTGPRASQLSLPGSIVVLPLTTSAAYVNLQTLWAQVPNQNTNSSSFADQVNGVQGTRICMRALTANAGIILGKTVADVTSANVPVIANQGTVSGGVYTGAAGNCWVMLATDTFVFEFEPVLGQDVFLGYIGSTNGSLQIYQCSQSNA